jgi:hypothetical protein
MNSKIILVFQVAVYILTSVMISSGVYAHEPHELSKQARGYVWSNETPSYRIYMEVMPADLFPHQPILLDDKQRLHDVIPGETEGLSHLLVSIYRKPGNEEVLDATLIAEVGPVSGKKTIKPLEKMALSTGVTYGNIFKVHQLLKHSVKLKIFNLNNSGYEEALFEHQDY